MLVEMSIYIQNKNVGRSSCSPVQTERGFSKQLEECLIRLCRELNAPIPIWVTKNTKEFAAFHQTMFPREQFAEDVYFDRMILRLIE